MKFAFGSTPSQPNFKKKQKKSFLYGSKHGPQKISSLTKNPREAAFLAFYNAEKQTCYMHEWLEDWRCKANPNEADYRLAQEIAFGTMRMKLALDFYACQLSSTFKAKPKILALIRTAIYQAMMMDKIPLYAIVNETVALAKKHFSQATAHFVNALLRSIERTELFLPQGESPQDISIRLSYPLYLVELFIAQFGKEAALEILRAGNTPPVLMAREIGNQRVHKISSEEIKEYVSSKQFYIQNSTPVLLFQALAKDRSFHPRAVLDLCSAPGGKLLLAHDYFPNAELFANDVSERKLEKIKENLQKYNIQAHLSCGPGEQYATSKKFDLILLDVPCSNTGVLNKRPEARWRINHETLQILTGLSKKLLNNALSLLAPNGRIWFMTCSILEEENQTFLSGFPFAISTSKLILPDAVGADGGYAAEIKLP